MPLTQKNMKNIYGLIDALEELNTKNEELEYTIGNLSFDFTDINNKLYELEHRFFQQDDEPSDGVNLGDVWVDTKTNTMRIYRESPIGSNIFAWDPLFFKNNDTIDGGYY